MKIIDFGLLRFDRLIEKAGGIGNIILFAPSTKQEYIEFKGLAAKADLSGFEVRFRCHPAIESPIRSLDQDLDAASYLVYRKTSLVLDAIRYSVKPLYYHDRRGKNEDCLFRLRVWKKDFKDAGELEILLKKFDFNENDYAMAFSYVRRYQRPVTDESITKLVYA